jgi:hypothetical protein
MENSMELSPQAGSPATSEREQAIAIQEVQAALVIAKRFPRDEDISFGKIISACKRSGLADKALYSYARAKARIEGPSINLAKAMARLWGNLDYGIRELTQEDGSSTMEAYCWDLETNTKERRVFHLPHERKARGEIHRLEDPRDVYELTANMGARRLRACILGIIPDDITEAAVKQINKTLTGGDDTPIKDKVRQMLVAFQEYGVTAPMIEKYLGHKKDAATPQQLANLRKIYNSIKDGISKREDWFKVDIDLSNLQKQADKKTKEKQKGKEASKQPDIPEADSRMIDFLTQIDDFGEKIKGQAMELLGFDSIDTPAQAQEVIRACENLVDKELK